MNEEKEEKEKEEGDEEEEAAAQKYKMEYIFCFAVDLQINSRLVM